MISLTHQVFNSKHTRKTIRSIVLIRFSPTTTTSRMLPVARIETIVGRSDSVSANSQQRPKRIERIEPSVESKGELVEVSLQVLWADAMMDAPQPRLEV